MSVNCWLALEMPGDQLSSMVDSSEYMVSGDAKTDIVLDMGVSSEDLPPLGREFSGDAFMLLRENSMSLSFSREASNCVVAENSILGSRNGFTPLSREGSLSLSWPGESAFKGITAAIAQCPQIENASALDRQLPQPISQLISSADIHGFFHNTECSFTCNALRNQQQPACVLSDVNSSHQSVDEAVKRPQPKLLPPAPLVVLARHASPKPALSTSATRPPLTRGAPRTVRALPGTSQRGAHVKDRPDMQKTARDGAVHWSKQLKLVRDRWERRATACPHFRERYQPQIDACTGRVKSKQECLLRTLQFAAADGAIVASPPPAGGGFFGWGRFDVTPARAGEFRRAVAGLFPAGFREDAVKEAFRRAALVPDKWQWELAWKGVVPWIFSPRNQ